MLSFAYWLTIKIYRLARFLPGNLLRAWLCTPRGYTYALPATLLVVPYALFAYWLYCQIQAGAAEPWLLLIVMGCALSIRDYLTIGFWVIVLSIRARIAAARDRRKTTTASADSLA